MTILSFCPFVHFASFGQYGQYGQFGHIILLGEVAPRVGPAGVGRTTLGSRTDDIEHISNKYQTN